MVEQTIQNVSRIPDCHADDLGVEGRVMIGENGTTERPRPAVPSILEPDVGLGIVVGGLLLLLPLPIPFSNMVPAWAVVLLTAGMMERDGLVALLGHTMTLVSWAFIILASLVGAEGFHKLFNMF